MTRFLLKAEFPIILSAGILSQKLAATLWRRAYGEAPPDTADKDVRVAQLVAAAVVEGTLYKLSRMAIERCLRVAASRSSGTWIGERGQGE